MFPTQENEFVIIYVRKHWIWLFVESLRVFAFFIVPVSFAIVLDLYFVDQNSLFFNYPVTKLLTLFTYIWAIFSWGFMADRFTKYALNFWVLTNKKLVESEHLLLFSRKLSTLELESVEDITVKFDGPIETLLNFGSLTVQTAGAQREFLADDIKDPEFVKLEIFRLINDIKQDQKNVTIDAEKKETETQRESAEFEIRKEIQRIFETNKPETMSQEVYDWAHK